MKIKNASNQLLIFNDLFRHGTQANVELDPHQELIIYNEDAEKSNALKIFIDAGLVIVLESGTEPSTGTSVAESLLPGSVGNEISQWNANKLQGVDISLTVPTNGQLLTYSNITSSWKPADPTAINNGHTIQDEGISLTDRATLNFTGTGVTVIDTGTKTEVQIPSSGGHIIEDESISLTQRSTLNFVGSGVTVTDTGTKTQVSISGSSQTYTKEYLTVASPISDHTILLSNIPASNSVNISFNGLVLRESITHDYTISGSTITINAAIVLTIGDEIQITYTY